MLKDTLKKEIDNLNDEQLKKIADFIILVKAQDKQKAEIKPFWQRATPAERTAFAGATQTQDFREWVSQLSHTSPSLPDEAFARSSIYD